MDKQIKIYKLDGKYCFTVNKFSSIHHSRLTKIAESSYRYAWEAYDTARKIATKHSYHLEVLEKFALEDLTKPVVEDVSAEARFADHYEEIYDGLVDTAVGMEEDDKLQKKVNYFEAKAVLQEILFVLDKQKEDELGEEEDKEESSVRLNSLVKKIKSLVHKYYKEDLEKDKKNSEEQGNALPGPEEGMEDPMGMGDPMGDPMGGMDAGMGGDMGMPMASAKSLIKVASRHSDIDDECYDELVEEYGRRACRAIERKHPDAICKVRKGGLTIVDISEGSVRPILYIEVGDDLFVESISPGDGIRSIYPYNSVEFYQAYWKPIVESIGHCSIGSNKLVLNVSGKSLPDKNQSEMRYDAINKDSKEIEPYTVSFRGRKPSWFVEPFPISKTAASENTRDEYFANGKGAIVVCTDPTLPSYYKRTGHVVQVIPFGSDLEVDINFGNHICRMVESQFDIIDGL